MEKQPHQEYRDELADKLKEIRNSDPENHEKAKTKAEGYLEAKKEEQKYIDSKLDKERYFEIKEKQEKLKNFYENVKLTSVTIDENALDAISKLFYDVLEKYKNQGGPTVVDHEEAALNIIRDDVQKIIEDSVGSSNMPGEELLVTKKERVSEAYSDMLEIHQLKDKILSCLEPNSIYFFPKVVGGWTTFAGMGGRGYWLVCIIVDSHGKAKVVKLGYPTIINEKDRKIKTLVYSEPYPSKEEV